MSPILNQELPGSQLSASYRYIFVDTLSDEVLVELPLVDVSYTKSLNEAGTFNGSLPITSDTAAYDIYNTTLPGKTSVYVLRNGVCVWGGIVSTRSYNIKEKILDITADDFISYLDRRFLWKTYSLDKACKISIFEDPNVSGRMIGKVTLAGEDVLPTGFAANTWVYLYFGSELVEYAGQFKVLDPAAPNNSTFGITTNSFHFGAYYRATGKKNLQPMKETTVSSDIAYVRLKQKTDDFVEDLLSDHFINDLQNIDIANQFIAPAELFRMEITNYGRTNNIATVTVAEEDSPHYLVPGQIVAIRDLPGFSTSKTKVIDVLNDRSFTYAFTGANVTANTAVTTSATTITHWQRSSNTVTITTATNHGLAAGDIVRVEGLEVALDSTLEYYVNNIGTSNPETNPLRNFQILSTGKNVKYAPAASGAKVTRLPIVEAYSAGAFSENADIGIQFAADSGVDGKVAYIDPIRGYELKTFKEILDSYATDVVGFDYRIDYSYNQSTNTFSKQFVFLPLKPTSVTTAIANLPGGVLPEDELAKVSYFNADRIAFEYPGNISTITLVETIQGGGTRAWVQGRVEDVSSDASQPYAVRADHEFLSPDTPEGRRWPIFDMKITKDKISTNKALKSVADKLISQAQLPISAFQITVNGAITPQVSDYQPGDWCVVSIDDPFVSQRLASYYENKGDTTRNVLLRKIASVQVQLSTNPILPEEVTLELVTEPSVDITGGESWRG
jgi:hypothetical protein